MSVSQLSKDGFYLRQNDLVRDILLDHDDVDCKVETKHDSKDKKQEKKDNKDKEKQDRSTKNAKDEPVYTQKESKTTKYVSTPDDS